MLYIWYFSLHCIMSLVPQLICSNLSRIQCVSNYFFCNMQENVIISSINHIWIQLSLYLCSSWYKMLNNVLWSNVLCMVHHIFAIACIPCKVPWHCWLQWALSWDRLFWVHIRSIILARNVEKVAWTLFWIEFVSLHNFHKLLT